MLWAILWMALLTVYQAWWHSVYVRGHILLQLARQGSEQGYLPPGGVIHNLSLILYPTIPVCGKIFPLTCWNNYGIIPALEAKPEQHKVTFFFPIDVLDTMRRLAKDHQRSLIGEIIWALRHYIKQQQSQETDGDHQGLQNRTQAE